MIRLGADSEEVADRLVSVVVVIAALTSPFYNTDAVRHQLVGPVGAAPLAVPVVLCLSLAVAWWSLMHRGYLWAEPAWLTWSDFDGSRPKMLLRRLISGWVVRFAAVAYAVGVGGMLLGWPTSLLPLCAALFASVAALAFAAARTAAGPVRRWTEQLVPLALTVVGTLVASGVLGVGILWGVALVLAVPAAVLAAGTSLPLSAQRAELVEGFFARMIRRTSAGFLDVWALLPQGRALAWRSAFAGGPLVIRFAVVGVLTRGRSALFALLLAVTMAALHVVLPGSDPLWWLGLGGYFAILPLSASIAQLHRVPGLRRWLDCDDRVLRLASAGVLLAVAALWFAVTLALGVPWSVPAALTVPLVVAAVVRTVTRPPVDFHRLGLFTVEGLVLPVGLVVQLARGPEVLVIGLLLLGAGVPFAVPFVVMLSLLAIIF